MSNGWVERKWPCLLISTKLSAHAPAKLEAALLLFLLFFYPVKASTVTCEEESVSEFSYTQAMHPENVHTYVYDKHT